jgi:hypothetical protein
MSSTTFHVPSGCVFQTVTYFPFSLAPFIDAATGTRGDILLRQSFPDGPPVTVTVSVCIENRLMSSA